MATDIEKAPEALQELVARPTPVRASRSARPEADLRDRARLGAVPVWYASPLPFTFGFGILNDTEARSVHSPSRCSSPSPRGPRSMRRRATGCRGRTGCSRSRVRSRPRTSSSSIARWRRARATRRAGHRGRRDGLVLLLEATRRAVGWPMAALAALFIAYSMGGPWLPEVLSHKARSVNRLMSHMWLTRGRVRHRARRVDRDHLRVRAVRHAARPCRRRQLHDAGVVRGARTHARRPAKVAVVSSALTASSPDRRYPTSSPVASSPFR